MGELKARERWTSEHLYKKDTYSGTFDGRKIAVLRSHTSHKTVRQSVSDVMISGLPKITGPNLFEPHFSVSALIIKQFGRLFSA
jgi:hypothetical protein